MKRTTILIVSTLIAFAFLFAAASPILATEPEPSSVELENIKVFAQASGLLAADDFLAIVPYYIPYSPTAPSVGIDEAFIFRLLSPDGSMNLGSVIAYPYHDNGYGYGVVSFYIATKWPTIMMGDALIFRIQQNPVVYSAPKYWDFAISDSNYSHDADQAAALKTTIVALAKSLTVKYALALLTKSEAGLTVLSPDGEQYFLSAIPGLQSMCPALLGVNLENPDFTRRNWSYSFANALKTKYAGTFFEEFMTGFAGLFSMETTAAMNFLSIVLFVTVIIISIWKGKASMLAAFTDGYVVLLLLMLMGFADMVMVGVIAFLSSTIGGVILFLNRS